jgi:hypothetical protein
MAATGSSGYTIGARVICPGYKLHLTLAYVGTERDTAKMTKAVLDRSHKPIRLVLGEDDLFGPPEKRDIPVVRCSFADPEVQALWQSFYDEHGMLSPGLPGPKPSALNYHISVKKPGSKEALRALGQQVVCSHVFMEQIGPGQEPVFLVPLPRVILHKEPVPGCMGEHPHCPCDSCEEHHYK